MYTIARTTAKRPTLMHRMSDWSADYTACGLMIASWSRAYMTIPVPQILCKRCGYNA